MTSPLALLGGPKTRADAYPAWPVHDDRDVEAVTRVVRSGRWGGFPFPGPETAALAEDFTRFQGGGHAVPMANGTITMEVALRAAGIGWGDEVIVPAYTFQATAAAPMAAGAVPVIVDVLPDTYCIDPAAVEAAITPRTRAIIPVHLGASMADMDASVYEWAAEAVIGAADGYYNGRANFYLYDHPTRGFIWFPHDMDTAFADDFLPEEADPIFPSCVGRWEKDWRHYLITLNEAPWREKYITALAEARAAYDADLYEQKVDQFSARP